MARRKYRRRKRKLKQPVMAGLILFILAFSVYALIEMSQEARMPEYIPEPVQSDLDRNEYDWSKLKKNGSFMTYEDEKYTSMQGIDVSSHQEEIDWGLVKEDGIEFAFIRAGYRGTTEGRIHADEYFEENMRGALENGIPVGVYFFSQAMTEEEAKEEAAFTLEKIKGCDVTLPVVFDLEEPEYEEGPSRVTALSREEKTQVASVFLYCIQNAGYDAMLYDSTMLFEEHYDISYLQDYRFWAAEYGGYPRFDYTFEIWQYSESGTVKGISEPVDMDIWFIKKD